MRLTLRIFLPLLYVVMAMVPGYVFFSVRGGTEFLQGLNTERLSVRLFPLVGLYAFFFVWAQVIIGTTRHLLLRVFPRIVSWHKVAGAGALLFALSHPTMIIIGHGLQAYLAKTFVAPELWGGVYLGAVSLFMLVLTAGSALLMKLPWLRRRWHFIHYANYVVFGLVWVHSWWLGSDVQSTNLRYMWMFYAVTAAIGVVIRLTARRPAVIRPPSVVVNHPSSAVHQPTPSAGIGSSTIDLKL